MPRRLSSSLSRAALFAISLAAASAAVAKPPPHAPPKTTQAALALEFLGHLENGQYSSAHALLDEIIRQRISVVRLKAARPPGRRNASNYRIVRYEGAVRQEMVKGAVASRRYYAVCMSDRPQKGSGGMGYVAVTLSRLPASQQWKVFDFRFQSDIPVICR